MADRMYAAGCGLGVGAASFVAAVTQHTDVAFRLPWHVLALIAGALLLICVGSALLSIWKVIRLEPAIVFRSYDVTGKPWMNTYGQRLLLPQENA